MALAGDHEVFVTVQAQFDGPPQLARRYRRPHGQVAGLRLFAAKPATHAPTLHTHSVAVDAQGVRHPVLHLSGVLGARLNPPLVLFQRHGVGNLAFEIKMLLPTHFKRPLQPMPGRGQPGGRVAPAHMHRWQYKALGLQRFVHRQHGGQRGDVELHRAHRAPRLHDRLGHDQANHLADVLHRVDGKYGLVVRKGGQPLVAGYVGCQNDAPHARHRQRSVGVHAIQAPVGYRGQNGRGVQGAPDLGQVIDVVRGAGDLRAGAFMEVGVAHRPRRRGAGGCRRCGRAARQRRSTGCIRCFRDGVVHGIAAQNRGVGVRHTVSSRRKFSRLTSLRPWLSSQKRCSKLPSMARR